MSDFKNKFQKICQDARLVGANIVIVKDDKVIEKENFGYASLEKKQKTSDKTIYRIASISKTVASIALMQLYEQGKIDLEEDISKYFGFEIRNPKFKDIKITPKMIMLQTSSITDGFDDEDEDNYDLPYGYNGVNVTDLDVSLEELLIPNDGKYYTPDTYSDYAPGTHFIYSNFGCGLMACLVEIASGEYFVEYMKNHIFKPLAIDASYRARDILRKENIASLYVTDTDNIRLCRTGESFVNGGYSIFKLGSNYRGPAGGLFIDMDDLSKIMRMFINRGEVDGVRLLKAETVDYMYQAHWFGYGDGGDYRAKGLQMKILSNFSEEGIVFRGHTGGAYGVRSYMYYNEKNKIGACFITNGGFYKYLPEQILDVFKYTLEALIDEYYPTNNNSTFTFDVNEKEAFIDDRKIIFSEAAYEYNDEVYIPAISLADGLDLVASRKEEDDSVEFIRKGKQIKLENLTNFDGVLMAPTKKVSQALGLEYIKKDGKVIIKY